RKTGKPVVVTRRGTPVAQVVPPPAASRASKSRFGCMAGTAREVADIVKPLPASEWEALG
ncbi:MAG: type II toxin-antitoxin system Phd/YefM family antitoxin, partial [Candidatus Binatia bacterium]